MRSTYLSVPFVMAAMAPMIMPLAAEAQTRALYFALDSARLTAEHETLLDATAADYRTSGTATVGIEGHTDTSGNAAYNQQLSERRAEAVSAALIARGVPAGAITTGWRGEGDLAVQTPDGTVEQANRRVEVSVNAPTIATAPTPVAAAPVEMEERLQFSIGPFVGYNNQPDDESVLAGVNLMASYNVNDVLAISAEQAGFYSFGSDDEGFGGRSALGADVRLGEVAYIGANGGYTYIEGSARGGWFAGPEIGLRYEGFEAKVAYDIYVNERGRDWSEGVITATIGYGIKF